MTLNKLLKLLEVKLVQAVFVGVNTQLHVGNKYMPTACSILSYR